MIARPEPRAVRNQSLPVKHRYRLMRVWQVEAEFVAAAAHHSTVREFVAVPRDLRVEALLSEAGIDLARIGEGLPHEAG